MRDRPATRKPGVRTKLFVAEETIGIGKIELLEALNKTGSIKAAAETMKMDYRRAWFLLHSTQAGFEPPLFEAKRGGARKGGTQLTEIGKQLIAQYYQTKQQVDDATQPLLSWLERHQAKPSDLHPEKQKTKES